MNNSFRLDAVQIRGFEGVPNMAGQYQLFREAIVTTPDEQADTDKVGVHHDLVSSVRSQLQDSCSSTPSSSDQNRLGKDGNLTPALATSKPKKPSRNAAKNDQISNRYPRKNHAKPQPDDTGRPTKPRVFWGNHPPFRYCAALF